MLSWGIDLIFLMVEHTASRLHPFSLYGGSLCELLAVSMYTSFSLPNKFLAFVVVCSNSDP